MKASSTQLLTALRPRRTTGHHGITIETQAELTRRFKAQGGHLTTIPKSPTPTPSAASTPAHAAGNAGDPMVGDSFTTRIAIGVGCRKGCPADAIEDWSARPSTGAARPRPACSR